MSAAERLAMSPTLSELAQCHERVRKLIEHQRLITQELVALRLRISTLRAVRRAMQRGAR